MKLEQFLRNETSVNERVEISDGWMDIIIYVDHEDLFLCCLSPSFLDRKVLGSIRTKNGVTVSIE